MTHDRPNLRRDLLFTGVLPRRAYQRLGFGEELMILDCVEDVEALKARMYQWGRRQKERRRYRVTVVANRTYVKCLSAKRKPDPDEPPPKLVEPPRPTRSRLLAPVSRRRMNPPLRTEWRRDPERGVYSCKDQVDGTFWALHPRRGDGVWLWTIYRDGVAVAKSRTLVDAKAEAAALL